MHSAFGLDIPQTLPEMCDPRTMAVLVYDMQIGVVEQIKNGPEIVSKIRSSAKSPR